MSDQLSAITKFRKLHESGCFVLPNPWDIGSAIYLDRLGFKALATTSAGFAFSRGLQDSVAAVPCELMLDHIRDIASSTSLPVNADFQTGYADEPEGVAANVLNLTSVNRLYDDLADGRRRGSIRSGVAARSSVLARAQQSRRVAF